MVITMIVEGNTERAFIPFLREYLKRHISDSMPKIDPFTYNGLIPSGDKLKRVVNNLLNNNADHVIALTDVYTGKMPHLFSNAEEAKEKLRHWVGNENRFHPHAAQFEFEAWLLPYWPTIQRLARHNRNAPSGNPEMVNHNRPPSRYIKDIFYDGKSRSYSKVRDAMRILRENDLSIAVEKCSELKSLVNTIISVSGGSLIP